MTIVPPDREHHLLAWRDAAPWHDAAPLALDVDRVVVLAAHPGDERRGAGGLLALAQRAGIDVWVLVVTDGSDEDSRTGYRREVVTGVEALAPGATVAFLGVAEGGVRAARALVSETVGAMLTAGRARRTLLVGPWWGDADDDHRVLGDVARAFGGEGVRVAGYPVGLWERPDPSELGAESWRVLDLDEAAVLAKREAQGGETLTPVGESVEVFLQPRDKEGATWSAARFDTFHGRSDDPWGLATRWYERRKRALLLASLPREHYERTLELGCSTGVTTRALAERSGAVVGVDGSQVALDKAVEWGVPDNVDFVLGDLPGWWPEGSFDLIVVSELAYYWTPEEYGRALDLIARSATDDAVLIACHWRKTKEGTPLTGDDVHAAMVARPEWRTLSRHVEEDFLMDVLVRPGVPAVSELPDA